MRAAIFDMDGTLLDSMGMWTTLDSQFLRSHGIEPPEDLTDTVIKMTLDEACAYYAENFPLRMTAEEIRAEVLDFVGHQYRETLLLKAGAADFLCRLKEQGIPFCVVTATGKELAEAALSRCGILPMFKFLITPDDGLPGKQQPDVYLEAARRLGASPRETAVFEDALHAAETAKRAGFYTVGFYDNASRGDWDALEAICDKMAGSWFSLMTPEFMRKFRA